MGEADRHGEYKRVKQRFSLGYDGNAVTTLFILNVTFFLLLLIIKVFFFFNQQSPAVYEANVLDWFALPSGLKQLSERPWTILSYMFSDTSNNIMRILSNMLWLWAFGKVLQDIMGNNKIIPIYIYGGWVGALFFIIAHYAIPSLHPQIGNAGLLGANCGTLAVAMATTTLSPDHRFFTQIRGGIPIWVLMVFYLVIDLAGISTLGAAYALAHIGGALAGFLFVFLLKRGNDLSTWMINLFHWTNNLFNPNKPQKQPAKEKVFYNAGSRTPYQKQSIVTQQRVDEILDKINVKGYHFLTEEEKDILKKAAEEDL